MAVRNEAVIRPLADGSKFGGASVQAAAQALGLALEGAPPAAPQRRRPELVELRHGALVLGRDPRVADQPGRIRAFCAVYRRHAGSTAVAGPLLQFNKVSANVPLQTWPE